jgi:hypothetical protein
MLFDNLKPENVSKREGYLCFFLSRLPKFSCIFILKYQWCAKVSAQRFFCLQRAAQKKLVSLRLQPKPNPRGSVQLDYTWLPTTTEQHLGKESPTEFCKILARGTLSTESDQSTERTTDRSLQSAFSSTLAYRKRRRRWNFDKKIFRMASYA